MRQSAPVTKWQQSYARHTYHSHNIEAEPGEERCCPYDLNWPSIWSTKLNSSDYVKLKNKMSWPAQAMIDESTHGFLYAMMSDWELIPDAINSMITKFKLTATQDNASLLRTGPSGQLSHYFHHTYYVAQQYRLQRQTFCWCYISNQSTASAIIAATKKSFVNPDRLDGKQTNNSNNKKKRNRNRKNSNNNNSNNNNNNKNYTPTEMANIFTDKLLAEQWQKSCNPQSVAEYPMILPKQSYWLMKMRIFRQSLTLDHMKPVLSRQSTNTIWCASCDQAMSIDRFHGCHTKDLSQYWNFDPDDDQQTWIKTNHDKFMCPPCIQSHFQILQVKSITFNVTFIYHFHT